MRRLILALIATLALMTGLTVSASAQADLGNDGVDTNCNNNFFTSTEQAREYFANDGGSIDRNVDDLDRDRDGTACDAGIDDVGGDGSQFPGGGTDDGAADDGTDDDGSDDGETSELPDTGVGTMSNGSDSMLLVTALSGVAALLGVAALRVREQS